MANATTAQPDYRKLAYEARRRLFAVDAFSPLQAAAFLDHLRNIFDHIETRIGYLEYALDQAGIKRHDEGGIPDDKAHEYFCAMPDLFDYAPDADL